MNEEDIEKNENEADTVENKNPGSNVENLTVQEREKTEEKEQTEEQADPVQEVIEDNSDVISSIEQLHEDIKISNTLLCSQAIFICIFLGFYLARLVYSKFLRV